MQIKKITILSGGSAIKDIMFELLKYPHEIIRVVPSTDNGSSSKELRDVFNVLSVGDIRQSLAMSVPYTQENKALLKFINWRFPIEEYIAIEELQKLLENKQSILYEITNSLKIQKPLIAYLWRFLKLAQKHSINLSNGSIGNFILLGAYFEHEHDWNKSLLSLEHLFDCSSKVIPIYNDNTYHLQANFRNGTIIYGEHEISDFQSNQKKEIDSLDICTLIDGRFKTTRAIVNSNVLTALSTSELIIFSPGSLFTSILPHLINEAVPSALAQNKKAKKVFLINLTQDSETKQFTAYDIIYQVEKIAIKKGYELRDFISHIIVSDHHGQVSFFNMQKEKKYYIQIGNLKVYEEQGISIIIKDLENPWKRGEFDPQEVVSILLTL